MNENLTAFLAQAKARSEENKKSFKLLVDNGCFGVAIGMLRQELDTLIRLCYLWSEETSVEVANTLIEKSVNGEQWKVVNHNGNQVKVTDRDMVNLASHLGGWENVIYSLGCKLIHLSDYHLYATEDPFRKIEESYKQEIIHYLKKYHDYPNNDINLNLLIEYLPRIMSKLEENIDFYIEELDEKLNK